MNFALETLKNLQTELNLAVYPKTTNRCRQEPYALGTEDMSPELSADLESLLNAMVDPYSEVECFKMKLSIQTVMSKMAWIERSLGIVKKQKGIPSEKLRLTDLVSFAPNKTALRRARNYDEVRMIEQAALEAADKTFESLRVVLNYLRKERNIHPRTEKTVVDAFLTIAKKQYFQETDP